LGGERVSGGKVRGAAGVMALDFSLYFLFCHRGHISSGRPASGAGRAWGYFRNLYRGAFQTAFLLLGDLGFHLRFQRRTCTAIPELSPHCHPGSTRATPRVGDRSQQPPLGSLGWLVNGKHGRLPASISAEGDGTASPSNRSGPMDRLLLTCGS